MTPEEIRIACAEELGWKRSPENDWLTDGFGLVDHHAYVKDGQMVDQFHLPNYPSDANAALELIGLLVKDGYCVDVRIGLLGRVTIAVGKGRGVIVSTDTFSIAVCRVFLCVRGKWKE